MGGNCPSLVQEWESAHSAVYTLTEFNGHLYSGGWKSNKIQKWNEQGQLVQEWETVHTHVVTLTEFHGHLYSGGNGNKIQKWNEQVDIEPLSLPPRLTRNRKMELLNQQSELEEVVVKCLEEIEQQETKKETEYVQRGVQNEGRHLQEMQRLQQNFQEGMQRREQEIQRRE